MGQAQETIPPIISQKKEPREMDKREEERAMAADEFIRQFNEFNLDDQSGVKSLLDKMSQEDKGGVLLGKVLNSVGEKLLTDKNWTGGEEAKDGRVQVLCLLAKRENDLVGRTFTVGEIIEIFEKTIYFNAGQPEGGRKESEPVINSEEQNKLKENLIEWFDNLEGDEKNSLMKLLSLMIIRNQISLPFNQAVDLIAEKREINRYWLDRNARMRGEDIKKDELFSLLAELNEKVGQTFTAGEIWKILHNKK